MKGVAVTGMGIVSSIGNDLLENYDSLKKCRDGLGFPKILETEHDRLPVGEVPINNHDLAKILGLEPGNSYTRTAMLACMSIKDLLKNTGKEKFEPDTGFISGTSVGGIDMTERYFHEYSENSGNLRFIQAQHPGFTTEKTAEYFNLTNFVTTISTACSSSANAIMLGARMIQAGKLKRVLVGGSDCLTRFTLNGFNSLMILSKNKCRPFDKDRDGLNLGEAAAYLLLEAEDCVKGKPVLGRVTGYGNSNDAFHQTASSENGEGAFQAMAKALKKAEISAHEIDYINAHGTGTMNNDLSESIALKRIFEENIPTFNSTKSFTGHTLGAAGAVEAVFCLLALQNNKIFPNLNFQNAISETGLKPVTSGFDKELKYILSNSFGFGGNCTSLIFQNA